MRVSHLERRLLVLKSQKYWKQSLHVYPVFHMDTHETENAKEKGEGKGEKKQIFLPNKYLHTQTFYIYKLFKRKLHFLMQKLM